MILTSKMEESEKKKKVIRVMKPLVTPEKVNHQLIQSNLVTPLAIYKNLKIVMNKFKAKWEDQRKISDTGSPADFKTVMDSDKSDYLKKRQKRFHS